MIIISVPSSGSELIGWLQVISGFLGVLVAALIAVYVANRQHAMQVEHQMRMDVAKFATAYRITIDNAEVLRDLEQLLVQGILTDRNKSISKAGLKIHEGVEKGQEMWRTLALYADPKISAATLATLAHMENLAKLSLEIFTLTKDESPYTEVVPRKQRDRVAAEIISVRSCFDELRGKAAVKSPKKSRD